MKHTVLWDLRFHQLEAYNLTNGNCNVSQTAGPFQELGRWVRAQRTAKRMKKLSPERVACLDTLQFAWKVRNLAVTEVAGKTDWNTRLEQLVEYKRERGDCNVSGYDLANVELGRWVTMQRHKNKKGLLSEERKASLASIGFVWRRRCHADWNVRFKHLLEYKVAFGDINVSHTFSPNPELWRWVRKQRTNKSLSKERIAKLNSVGFDWGEGVPHRGGEPNATSTTPLGQWASEEAHAIRMNGEIERVEQLHAQMNRIRMNNTANGTTKETTTNTTTTTTTIDNSTKPSPLLGQWATEEARAIIQMNNATKETTTPSSHQYHYNKQPYQEQQLSPPNNNTNGAVRGGITEWVEPSIHDGANRTIIRMNDNNNNGTTTNTNTTTTINNNNYMPFDCWETLFRELLAYLQAHGDYNVPECYPENPLLARWVSDQRHNYDRKRRGEHTSLTPLREAKLDAIGFTWFVPGSITSTTKDHHHVPDVVSSSSSSSSGGTNIKIKAEAN